MRKTIAVIGGGPSGMIAAGRAAELGAKVHLFDSNETLGNKLILTGKGRCNITNFTDIQNIVKNVPGNGKFLYSALNRFSNFDLINLLNDLGLETKVERGNRVFPTSDSAKDVVNTLITYMNNSGVRIHLNNKVNSIITNKNRIDGIKCRNGNIFRCDRVVLATGGLSYPQTGSKGEGYLMAEELGHNIIPLKPSLVPLCTKENWVKQVQGLALKNVRVSVYSNKEKILEEFGEMLFTHYGVSGPIILTASRKIVKYLDKQDKNRIKLEINLKPALNQQQLDNRLQRDFAKYSRKSLKNGLVDILPKKLVPVVIKLSSLTPTKPINQITKKERNIIVSMLTNLTLTIADHRPIEEAIVTMGGIAVDEINPNTLESKLVKGLFFAGEIIDIDGFTGGYNLQSAFSTGYVAGSNCVN